ncbi:MAG: hypothetical protein KAS15_08565 [Nanoarchaeota archaeon]|nr:hypothetical protein [Nanoarchaeota archaeon]MCK5629550.1 hypothetical protein [Nanoarchaeota archaeon]
MALTIEIKRKLLEILTVAPCSIQELAFKLSKNWRTIDNYISKMEEEGLLSTKEFKRGPRVAFKIVFIQPDVNVHISNAQKKILKKIESGRRSQDFSPLDIIQFLPEEEVTSYFRSIKLPTDKVTEGLLRFFKQTSNNLLMFSGDLSWVDLKIGKTTILDVIEQLAKDKIMIKIIARVDQSTRERIGKLLNINYKLGHDSIEIRHEEHPLRSFIVDGKIVRLKEPAFSSQKGELKKVGTFFYEFQNESWTNWLERYFWSVFRSSIPAEKRLLVLDKIKELKS